MKEKRKLEEKFSQSSESDKKMVKNMIQMEESQLKRLQREMDKLKGIFPLDFLIKNQLILN